MQIDMQWLESNFQHFNQQYFDGVLPTPRFHIGHSKTRLGSLSYKRGLLWNRRFPSFGGNPGNAFTLTISNHYDQTEHQFQSVLLHEMIHLSIAASGLRDTSPHGVIFRGMMARLNREGWDIQVMVSTRGMRKAYTGSEQVIRDYLVLALEMRDGKRFLSSVNPKFARQLNRQLRLVTDLRQATWYTTSNHWFEDMPRVRSLRGRHVTQDEFDRLVASMTPVTIR